VVAPLACALPGVDIDVVLTPGTRLAGVYGTASATEHATCSYGLALEHQDLAGQGGLRVAAVDGTGEVRAVERTDHPFFVATLFQPQLGRRPHPVFVGLIDAMGGPVPSCP